MFIPAEIIVVIVTTVLTVLLVAGVWAVVVPDVS
jgi:hypothetical protein